MNAPRELLDQLDQAHADAELGGWAALEFRVMTAPDAIPKLTAALRAVLAYCDDMDRADFFPGLASTDAIRTRITAALSPAQPQSGGPA